MKKSNHNIVTTLSHLKPISLEEMNAVALMKRLDSKFILSVDRLPTLLHRIKDDYALLTINDDNIFDYRTTYYDTDVLETYTDHLRGKSARHKVRIREYTNTEVCYFEVKKKQNNGVTDKVRIKTQIINSKLTPEQREFFDNHLQDASSDQYSKVLTNTFNRITLANPGNQERVTIDYNLSFSDDLQTRTFDNLCIIEIKQPRINRLTAMFLGLKLMQIRPLRISKYCLGVSALKDVKSNLFKPKLRTINKTIHTYGTV